MATKTWLRLYSSILHVRVTFGLTDALNAGRGLLVPRALHRWSANVPRRRKKSDGPQFVNCTALERGTTKYFCNRNPRSLELLGLAEKPRGFATKKSRVDYYHRYMRRDLHGGLEMSVSSHKKWLMFEVSSRHATAYVDHNNGTKVVEASTREFCIAKHLYKTSDVSAAYNIGRVIASRCKETGLYRVMWEHKMDRSHKKVKAFLRGVAEGGLLLNEPKVKRMLPKPGLLPR